MKTITVNKQNLSVKEYNGQRVVTFKDIDIVHGRPEGTAKRNFTSNREHFIEGTDYYKIQKNEIRTFGISSPRGSIALTLSGYLMLVKSFTDSLAWKVQRELVNTYFEAKAEQLPIYEFIEKKWKGQAVITIQDFEYFTGKQRDAVSYYLRHGALVANKDYYLLDGNELIKYKLENPRCNRTAKALYLITKSGFVKLLKYFGITIKTPECFNLPKPKETPQLPIVQLNYAVKKVVDVPDNAKLQSEMQEIRRGCEAIMAVLQLLNKYNSIEDYEKQLFVLDQLGMDVSSNICVFKRIKPNMIEKVF